MHALWPNISSLIGPQPGKARACGNLGNAYSALGQYGDALKYYQLSLVVAKDGNNVIGQGQVGWCRLGGELTLPGVLLPGHDVHNDAQLPQGH